MTKTLSVQTYKILFMLSLCLSLCLATQVLDTNSSEDHVHVVMKQPSGVQHSSFDNKGKVKIDPNGCITIRHNIDTSQLNSDQPQYITFSNTITISQPNEKKSSTYTYNGSILVQHNANKEESALNPIVQKEVIKQPPMASEESSEKESTDEECSEEEESFKILENIENDSQRLEKMKLRRSSRRLLAESPIADEKESALNQIAEEENTDEESSEEENTKKPIADKGIIKLPDDIERGLQMIERLDRASGKIPVDQDKVTKLGDFSVDSMRKFLLMIEEFEYEQRASKRLNEKQKSKEETIKK
ncbi:hypothetical protein NEAUS07_2519, partial [Nematocida ausubeli]